MSPDQKMPPTPTRKAFLYTVQDQAFHVRTGEIRAADEAQAVDFLQKKGFVLLAIKATELKASSPTSGSASEQSIMFFARELAMLIKGGTPLLKALRLLAKNPADPALGGALTQICAEVNSGTALHKAMGKHPLVFPRFFTALVMAGEESGKLPAILRQGAAYLASQVELRKKIRNVMIYPGIVTAVAVLAVIFFSIKVVPSFAVAFESFGMALPLPTRVVMVFSGLLVNHFFLVLAAVLAGPLALRFWMRTGHGRIMLSYIRLRVPILNPMFRHSVMERFYATIGLLLTSGVTLLSAMGILKEVLSNDPEYADAVGRASDLIVGGKPLSWSLLQTGCFDEIDLDALAAGEEAGGVGESLEMLAGYHKEKLEEFTTNMATLLEPAVVLFVGGLVGIILFALLLPIIQLSTMGGQRV